MGTVDTRHSGRIALCFDTRCTGHYDLSTYAGFHKRSSRGYSAAKSSLEDSSDGETASSGHGHTYAIHRGSWVGKPLIRPSSLDTGLKAEQQGSEQFEKGQATVRL